MSKRLLFAIVTAVLIAACRAPRDHRADLGAAQAVAVGVELYRTADSTFVQHAGPIAISLLKLDPAHVRLTSGLSNGTVVDVETVEGIAARAGAIAAVNGGFFNRENGEPVGLLKVAGELVSDAAAIRGAVVIASSPGGATHLVFDQLSARVTMAFANASQSGTLRIDGVDTTRARGKLMLYTPAYHADTDTAPTGTEWVLDGAPLRVVDVRMNFGHTRIPPNGAVLSYGGTDLAGPLAALIEGTVVSFATTWKSVHGVHDDVFNAAADIVNGAGLLRRGGTALTDWKVEALNQETFIEARHPRTLIGLDRHGFIWLAAIDGRQPDYSIGMTFADLERLCERLELTDALNLDGGGSTTMVVKGQVVNRPSDPGGARPVSDAVVVLPR